MLTLSWLLIAVPLASAATLLLAGRAARGWGHWLGVAASSATVVVGIGAFVEMLGRDALGPGVPRDALPVDSRGRFRRGRRNLAGSALDGVRAARLLRRDPDPPLLGRLHGARRQALDVLRLPQPLHRGDVHPRARGLLPPPVRRLGGRGPRVVPAHRVLEPPPALRVGRQQGIRRQPHRRHGPHPRDGADVRAPGLGGLRDGLRGRADGLDRGPDGDRLRAPPRRLRKVRPVPAPVVARRRHGRPDPGLGPHPRGDDGDGGRLPRRPFRPGLCRGAERPPRRRHRRRHHAADGRDHRHGEGRHQEGARGVDDVPDRLHDARRGPRTRGLRVRDLPPAHPRLLQGGHVPWRGLRDARDGRPGGHAALRRPRDA